MLKKILPVAIILIILPAFVFLNLKKTEPTKSEAFENNFFETISPGSSTISDVTQISGRILNTSQAGETTIYKYEADNEDDSNIVAIKNGRVSFVLTNVYSETDLASNVGTADPNFQLYDENDDSLIWNIYLYKGLAIAHVGGDVIKKVKFIPGTPKSIFMNSTALSLRLTANTPTAERINIDGISTDTAMTSDGQLIPCNQVRNAIKTEYGAIIDGALNCKRLRMIYYSLKLPFEFGQFRNLAKINKPYTIHLRVDNPTDGICSGKVVKKNDIYLYDFQECASSFPRTQHILLHEITHLVKNRNYREIYQRYNHSRNVANDSNCYDRSFLKTYSLRTTVAKNESISEAAALYFLNGWNGKMGKITNFTTECSTTRKAIKEKLFNY